MTDIVDSTAAEIGTDLEPVHSQPPANLFHTDDPVEVVEKATRVADALKDVIVQRGLFTPVQGKSHVNVDGWQVLGAMLGVTAVCVATEAIDGGYKATVEARTTAQGVYRLHAPAGRGACVVSVEAIGASPTSTTSMSP